MKEEFRCPKCHSSQTRYRVKTGDHICFVCGNIWEIKEGEKIDG